VKQLVALTLISLLFACNSSKLELQNDRDVLVMVTVDLYFAEAALNDLAPEVKDSILPIYRNQIAELHKVDLKSVEKDIANLQLRPSEYKEFHRVVEDTIAFIVKDVEKVQVTPTNDKK